MTDNDKNYIENSVLRVRLPMKASELERIIRVHCEHHGVWDDCIVKSEEDGNVETSHIRDYADRIEAAHERAVEEHEYAYKHKEAETDRIRAEKAAKDAEITKLRAFVKELADALNAINAKIEVDPYIGGKWNSLHMGSLVDKAREVCK